jgi:hypothetical protein
MHVDKCNLGPSYIVGVGDFEGGKLWVHRQKYLLQGGEANGVAKGYTPQELASLYTDGNCSIPYVAARTAQPMHIAGSLCLLVPIARALRSLSRTPLPSRAF